MNYLALAPELVVLLTVVVLVALGSQPGRSRWLVPMVGTAMLLVAAIAEATFAGSHHFILFRRLMIEDGYAVFFKLIALLVGILGLLGSANVMLELGRRAGRHAGMVALATLGAMVSAGSTNLLPAFLGLALTLAALLALLMLDTAEDGEEIARSAGAPAILAGGMGVVLLVGMGLIYLGTHHAGLLSIGRATRGGLDLTTGAGLVLCVLPLLGILAASAFHAGETESFRGAPMASSAVAALLSAVAAAAFLGRLLVLAFPVASQWSTLLAVAAAVLTMVGAFGALAQREVRSLLAFVGLVQAGLVAAALASGRAGVGALILLILAYALGASAVLLGAGLLGLSRLASDTELGALARRSPWAGLAITAGLVSLMGLPPLAGFFGWTWTLVGVARGGMVWLLGLLIVAWVLQGAALGRWILALYVSEAGVERRLRLPQSYLAVALAPAVAAACLFLFIGLLSGWAQQVAGALR